MKAFPLAFPLVSKEPYQYEWGMDLRDYFAAKAMQGICASGPGSTWTDIMLAKEAYKLADAMMEARKND